MKKSNWIILAILVVASVFFLWLWYYLNFNLVDNPLDLVLTIVWWAVVIMAVVAIHQAEKKRQERIRTSYIGSGCIFNAEAGLVRFEAGASPVETLAGVLSELKYNFDLADFPEKGRPQLAYVVRTTRFADNGDTWEGEVSMVDRPNDEPQTFANRDELLFIVEGVPLPVTSAPMAPAVAGA